MAKTKIDKAYIAQVELSDDETGKHWKVGSKVKASDFPARVIENWLTTGALVEKESEAEDGDK